MRDRVQRFLIDHGGAIALAVLVLYAWLAPSHVVDGDNAEFATLGHVGGVPHPSGYPLYLLWLRATSWIPAASPAHAAALATALIGATQVLVLHAAARAWGASAAAAGISVAVYAAAPIVLRLHTEAEVFALNGLCAAAILWLSAPDGPLRGRRRVVALGLAAGLGLSNHLTCVFLAPVGLAGVVRGVREADAGRMMAVIGAVVAFAIGLVPYAYLLVAPAGNSSWGRIDGFDDLVAHFLRVDYGATALAPRGVHVSSWASLSAFGATVGRAWWWLPPGLAIVGIVAQLRRGPRAAWVCLTATILIAGPLFATRFNIEPVEVGRFIVSRFHMLPAMLLAVPIAVGLTHSIAWIAQRRQLRPRPPVLATLAAIIALVVGTAVSLPRLARVHSPATQNYLEAVLRSAPADAVVIGQGDLYDSGVGYLQHALGRRPDVAALNLGLMSFPWYRDYMAARLGFAPPEGPKQGRGVRVAEAVLAHGRPLLVDLGEAEILAAYPHYPIGVLLRVLPIGTPPPPLETQLLDNLAFFEALDRDYAAPRADDDWTAYVHWRYAMTWSMLGDALAAGGRTEQAAAARSLAGSFLPK